MDELAIVRSSERVIYKRCETKWYWSYRKGLVLKQKKFGALDLGTWMHAALASWYQPGFARDPMGLAMLFEIIADSAIISAIYNDNAPDEVIEKAHELAALGIEMCKAYERKYGEDKALNIVGTEVPLEFVFPDYSGKPLVRHVFKPDAIFTDDEDGFWFLETKTAQTIKTGHLPLDDQARPYGAMAERALRKAGLMLPHQQFKGILYNFMRKGLPDERPTNEAGHALNKDGSVSKKQPNPLFKRYPVTMTRLSKIATLQRVRNESVEIATVAQAIRSKGSQFDLRQLSKTPHSSCERFCDYFTMCVLHESGQDVSAMQRSMFRQENPYDTYAETTDETDSFEMG